MGIQIKEQFPESSRGTDRQAKARIFDTITGWSAKGTAFISSATVTMGSRKTTRSGSTR